MDRIQNDPPSEIAGRKVVRRIDIESGNICDGATGETTGKIDLPSSRVVIFELEGGAKAVARPSGTEPKIKFYFFLAGEKQASIEGVCGSLEKLEEQKGPFETAFLSSFGVEN